MTTEVWETTNNIFHTRPYDNGDNIVMVEEGVDMKWVQMPDEFGGKKVNVVDKRRLICSCRRHRAMAYFLENDFVCLYCEIENGIVWFQKKTESEQEKDNEYNKKLENKSVSVNGNGEKKQKKRNRKKKKVQK